MRGYTVVRAPAAGVVAERKVAVGDLAQPGQTLVSLYNPDLLQVEGEVNDSYRDRVKIGEMAQVSVPAVKFVAQLPLAEIFPISAPGSRTFKVRTERLKNPALMPGMFARLVCPWGRPGHPDPPGGGCNRGPAHHGQGGGGPDGAVAPGEAGAAGRGRGGGVGGVAGGGPNYYCRRTSHRAACGRHKAACTARPAKGTVAAAGLSLRRTGRACAAIYFLKVSVGHPPLGAPGTGWKACATSFIVLRL